MPLGGSWGALGTILGRSWHAFGSMFAFMLDTFWWLLKNMFGNTLLHQFLMVFGKPWNVHFLIPAEAKTQFSQFFKVVVGIAFDFQNPSKIEPTMVPRGSWQPSKIDIKKTCNKNTQHLLKGGLHGPQVGCLGLPRSSQVDSKIVFFVLTLCLGGR